MGEAESTPLHKRHNVAPVVVEIQTQTCLVLGDGWHRMDVCTGGCPGCLLDGRLQRSAMIVRDARHDLTDALGEADES